MALYNLTNRQKDVLKKLVDGVENQGWGDTFLDASTHGGGMLIAFPGNQNIPIDRMDDMNVIASTGLMNKEISPRGTSRYIMTQAAYDAIERDFVIPEELGVKQNIGVLIYGNVAGPIQGVGYADEANVKQIVNDPENLRLELEKITSLLIDEVKDHLSGSQIVQYSKLVDELKKTFQDKKPNKSKVRNLIGALSLINDTSSTIDLIRKTLPYLGLLLQLAAGLFK